MGFVKRYWQEAEEKKIPHYHCVVIVELQTGAARVQRRGLANLSDQQFPELPLEFPTYGEAFAWVERKLKNTTKAKVICENGHTRIVEGINWKTDCPECMVKTYTYDSRFGGL